jgi:enoyl-CoA hydratase/carnithine racemase
MTESSPTHDEGQIVVEQRDALTLIGIDRPLKRNGFTQAMFEGLSRAFQSFEDDPGARVAVLHAFGDHFSAGLQLDQFTEIFREGRHLAPAGLVDPFQLHPPFRTKPCVAAMQGVCFTIAVELMLAADIVVAASNCRFAQLEVKRGIMANHGATLRFVERAGWGNAMLYLLTGDEFDAGAAHRMGLVQEIVPTGRQLERAIEIAGRIAAQAPLAVSATLASAQTRIREGFPVAVAELGAIQKQLFASEDATEGVRSFADRRTAVFTGR